MLEMTYLLVPTCRQFTSFLLQIQNNPFVGLEFRTATVVQLPV